MNNYIILTSAIRDAQILVIPKETTNENYGDILEAADEETLSGDYGWRCADGLDIFLGIIKADNEQQALEKASQQFLFAKIQLEIRQII